MKIIIQEDNGDETFRFENVFQFSMTGLQNLGIGPKKFSHSVIADKAELIGMLYENIERVRTHADRSS